jgi:DDE family transposase
MNLSISLDKASKIKANSGIYFLENIARKRKLKQFLDEQFPARGPQAKYSNSDIVLGLAYSFFCGGQYLEDVNWVKEQLDINSFLTIPSSDTIHYRVKQLFTPDQLIVSRTGVSHHFNINDPLNNSLLRLAVRLNPKWKTHHQVLDYDNTIVQTGKPDSAFTYKKKKGYMPGVLFVDGLPVYVEGRNGNSSSKYLMHQTLDRAWSKLQACGVKAKFIRIDGAAYQNDVFEWFSEHPDLTYYIRANKQFPGSLEEDKWEDVKVAGKLAQAMVIPYSGPGMIERDLPCRLVVYRIPNNRNQPDLFLGDYTYQFLLTNDMRNTAEYIIWFYNQRANCERSIDILKHDFNWNYLPFDNMSQNTVYMIFAAMANIIFHWFKTIISKSFPAIQLTTRIKRFILYFVNVPGKWIHTARQIKLKIYSRLPYDELIRSG